MDKHSSDFPFDFKSLDSERQAMVKSNYEVFPDCLLVGPRGYFMPEPYTKLAASIYNMPLRPGDVFVVSYPRSGTTWTQELVWLVANDLDYAKAKATSLTDRYPFLDECFFFDDESTHKLQEAVKDDPKKKAILEVIMQPAIERLASAPSPRFVKTHMPLSLLPPSLLDTAKVVYVARDPRDVAVSYFHFTKSNAMLGLKGGFEEFLHIFITDNIHWSPFFEHIKEAWEKRNHPNMLFLFYEELSKDLPGTARRVADFLGKQYSNEQFDALSEHLKFDNFRANSSVDLDTMRAVGIFKQQIEFIRKGKAGGWRDYITGDLETRMDAWMADKLRGTDLRFPEA